MAFGKQILHKSETNFLADLASLNAKHLCGICFLLVFAGWETFFKSHLGTSLLAAFPLFAWIFGKNCNFARSKQILKE